MVFIIQVENIIHVIHQKQTMVAKCIFQDIILYHNHVSLIVSCERLLRKQR